jgi:hypothetical protein
VRKSKPYAGRNEEQIVSTQNRLNYLAVAADDELREITQRIAEYRAAESVKLPKLKRIVLASTGTWVAPCSSDICEQIVYMKEATVIKHQRLSG